MIKLPERTLRAMIRQARELNKLKERSSIQNKKQYNLLLTEALSKKSYIKDFLMG